MPWNPVSIVFVQFVAFERGFYGLPLNDWSSSISYSKGIIRGNIGAGHGEHREDPEV